jgi:hypothetical protein
MCTVSVVPPRAGRGPRLVVNRDERRSREVGWPPRVTRLGAVRVAAPVDSQARGTWVAAASSGLAFALMNASPAGTLTAAAGRVSRGEVIPHIAGASELEEAVTRLRALPLASFAPFRLIAVQAEQMAVCGWNGERVDAACERLDRARLFASSSLGDELVEAPRRALFDRLLGEADDPWLAQDRLHVHAWPDRRHLSANMSRPDACTVSRTAVIAEPGQVEVRYTPFVDGWPGPVAVLTMMAADLHLTTS